MRLPVSHIAPLVALVLLTSCGGNETPRTALAPAPANGPAADYPMVLGSPFTIDGMTYAPTDKLNYDAVGLGTAGSEGGSGITAAHKTLPLPSYVEVTQLDTGKTILVRLERRGPMVNNRLIELSPGAAAQLGVAGRDSAPVRVRRVNPPEPERAALRSGQRAPDRMDTPKGLLSVLMRKLDPAGGPIAAPTAAPAPDLHPTPSASPRPAPRPIPAATQAAPIRGGLVVQAAAFSTRERAEAAARTLGGSVQPAGTLWRVRMGPFGSQAEANAALAKARGAGYSDARILRAD